MTRCASCGRRIWGSAVSIPGHGDYHYECAKLTGVLRLLEADLDRDALKKRVEELEKKIEFLQKRQAEGADPDILDEEWKRLRSEEEQLAALARRIERVEELKRKRV